MLSKASRSVALPVAHATRALFSLTPATASKIEADKARKNPLPLIAHKSGIDIIHDPLFNKGTGFTIPEKERMKLRGLVPPRSFPIELQEQRILNRFNQKATPLEKHGYLSSLQDRNETLFYRVLMDNISEMAPIIYTPTVGDACINFGHEYRRARGMYISAEDVGEMAAMMYNWPSQEVDVIVVTDGNRILGLGDLGAHGMGIPIGKLSLYVAAGGIHPTRVLPITIDVGTDNETLRNDPFYLGLSRPRIRGPEYFDIIEEFMQAVYHRWPQVLVQFEDFANHTALPLLSKYRNKYLCFNDDIQGTGAVTVAGLLSALRALRQHPRDIVNQRIVCVGAGSAGIGVCDSIVYAMREEGLDEEDAYKRFFLVDANGLLSSDRTNLHRSQRPYSRQDMPDGMSLLDVIRTVKPTILLGLSGVGKVFTEEVIREMKKHVEVPIIFPLSNPTSKAECSFEDAVKWTEGELLFASGSPFQPCEYNGRTYYPSQGNNMFIFPGMGLGAVVSKPSSLTDRMFYLASKELALFVPDEDIRNGKVYPDITKIRLLSERIACQVVNEAVTKGTARAPLSRSMSLEQQVHLATYYPEYQPLVVVDLD